MSSEPFKPGEKIQPDYFIAGSLDELYFVKGNYLSPQDIKLMKRVPSIRYEVSKARQYLANPYKTEFGQRKLFIDRGGQPHRVIVDDLTPSMRSNSIILDVKIKFIDKYQTLVVPIHKIYDFPPAMSRIRDIRPELHRCRFRLNSRLLDPAEYAKINTYFMQQVKPNRHDVAILRFDTESGTYTVDLVCRTGKMKGKLLGDMLASRFKDIIPGFLPRNGMFDNKVEVISKYQPDHSDIINLSSFEYFRKKYIEMSGTNPGKGVCWQLPIKVKVVRWMDSDTFLIIPLQYYFGGHTAFKKRLARLGDLSMDNQPEYDQELTYVDGQKCYFKNFSLHNMGIWLRGIVTQVPKQSYIDLLLRKEPHLFIVDPSKFVYKIISIDYGFTCFRSPENMRPVGDIHRFSLMCPFALKCSLFGIRPWSHDIDDLGRRRFSNPCKNAVEDWMRERILINEEDRESSFYVLFRTDISRIIPGNFINDESIFVNLLHRRALPPEQILIELPEREIMHFESLNSYLVDKGYATCMNDDDDTSSCIQLDEFILNKMADRGII